GDARPPRREHVVVEVVADHQELRAWHSKPSHDRVPEASVALLPPEVAEAEDLGHVAVEPDPAQCLPDRRGVGTSRVRGDRDPMAPREGFEHLGGAVDGPDLGPQLHRTVERAVLGHERAAPIEQHPCDRHPSRIRAGALRRYGPMPGSNIGRSSDSPSNSGQCFRCSSMNSVAMRTASALEDVCRIAKPPMTSLVSENGPSVTVILPFLSRTRTPSLLGNRPPVSTSVPSFCDFSTNLPIASISACGGGDSRYDSGWRMNVRYFMAPPVWASDHATNEPGPDRHADFRAA